MNTQNLKVHLEDQHSLSPFSTYLKEIVYGGTDGIVTTFAVVAGFAGAQSTSIATLPIVTVLLFGFANLFADGISMGLGNFLSTRSEQDVYAHEKSKEFHEISTAPESEVEESIQILTQKGFSPEDAKALTKIYQKNTPYWLNFMMDQELELPNPERDKPFRMALVTVASFVSFGLIPLIPYIVFLSTPNIFQFSSLAALLALLLLGLLRWKVSRQRIWRSIGETLLLGGSAAVVAYSVGTLFTV